jgi:hypothetical protein
MPVESFIKYKGKKIAVENTLLAAFNLLLFRQIHETYKENSQKFNELKIILANETLYMVLMDGITAMQYDSFLEEIEDDFFRLLDKMIHRIVYRDETIGSKTLNHLCDVARDYIMDIHLNEIPEYPGHFHASFGNAAHARNYGRAFKAIASFLKEG